MKILLVLTSHDQLGDTGKKTGFWLEELAAPYYALKDAGAEIVLASPKGGQPPLDPKSDDADAQTDDTRRFKGDAERYVVQGVHMIIEGDHQRPWKDGEKRESRLVFIGRELDRAKLEASFHACEAKA